MKSKSRTKMKPYYLAIFYTRFRSDMNGIPQFSEATWLRACAPNIADRLNRVGYHTREYKINFGFGDDYDTARLDFYGYKSK